MNHEIQWLQKRYSSWLFALQRISGFLFLILELTKCPVRFIQNWQKLIWKTWRSKVNIHAITFNGAGITVASCKDLGCIINKEEGKHSFSLMRFIYSSWSEIVSALQELYSMKAKILYGSFENYENFNANQDSRSQIKWESLHIRFQNLNMNVKHAAQLLNSQSGWCFGILDEKRSPKL